MKTVTPEEWAAILAKAKQKKAQEGNVDHVAALIVKEVASFKERRGVRRRELIGPIRF
jgi:hypothetical protein